MLHKYDKKKNPFKVPENYFDGLTEDIMSSLPAKERQVKKAVLWKKVLPWVSVAALVALIAVSVTLTKDAPNMLAQEESKTMSVEQKYAYNGVEDYFLFLEDESTEAMYIDVILEDE